MQMKTMRGKTSETRTASPDQYRQLWAAQTMPEALRNRQLILMALDCGLDAPLPALRAFADLIRADMRSAQTDDSWLTNYTPWPTPIPTQLGTTPASTTSENATPPVCANDTKKPSSGSIERGYIIPCLTRNDFAPTEWPTPSAE